MHTDFFLREHIPDQYIFRAAEAKKILSIRNHSSLAIASRIALAELSQIIFFISQTIIFSLAFYGLIPSVIAGSISCVLIPFEAYFAYNTLVHFKPFSRITLTIAAVITLITCAAMALFGIISDSAITLCAGGVIFHLFRNISECIDARKAKKDNLYRFHILNESTIAEPIQNYSI